MNTYPGQRETQAQIEPAARRFGLRGSGLDWPLAGFWLTAGLAVIVAYDAPTAQAKFWIITISIVLFYAIAGLGGNYTRLIAISLAGLGAAITIGFLLLHDWRAQPADFAAVNWIGRQIMAVRPTLAAVETAPNRVGGILAALLPVVVALAARNGGSRSSRAAITDGGYKGEGGAREDGGDQGAGGLGQFVAGAAAVVMVFGLVMTSSRAAWAALLAGAGVWLLVRLEAWWVTADNGWYRRQRNNVHLFLMFAGLVLMVLGLILAEELVVTLDHSLPGEASALSRQRIILNSFRLAEDFVVVGSGLGSFPGLYSEYMLVVPYYSFGYAHNLYLDVQIEQGAVGMAMLIVILVTSLGMAWGAAERGQSGTVRRLAQGVFVGLMVMVIHGLADDAFYGESGVPLLFLLPALALHLKRQSPQGGDERPATQRKAASLVWRAAGAALPFILTIVAFIYFHDGLARIYANIGSIYMARVQLADFPADEWSAEVEAGRLDEARVWLDKAWALDTENRTANQRLGLISLLQGDHTAAADYLERAYAADPRHTGVVKNLGYIYVWLGRSEQALPLLKRIPEARPEMEAYATWWRQQGRPELAEHATEMANRLR